MTDRLGALTNFALRVLYKDALDKLESKRLLYGWGLSEINRRCLLLAGVATDTGGEVVWPDPLPLNEAEQAQTVQTDLGMEIVSKQTASETRGYDWETEQARMEEEQSAQGNIGEQLLTAFTQGRGGSNFGRAQQQPAEQVAEEAQVGAQG
jgi:hypothetical protein